MLNIRVNHINNNPNDNPLWFSSSMRCCRCRYHGYRCRSIVGVVLVQTSIHVSSTNRFRKTWYHRTNNNWITFDVHYERPTTHPSTIHLTIMVSICWKAFGQPNPLLFDGMWASSSTSYTNEMIYKACTTSGKYKLHYSHTLSISICFINLSYIYLTCSIGTELSHQSINQSLKYRWISAINYTQTQYRRL